MKPIEIPKRVYRGDITNSNIWSRFEARPDDIYVVTPPKSGTTWVQAIVALLLAGPEGVTGGLADRSPWVDADFGDSEQRLERLRAIGTRRYLKTHTPLDGIPNYSECRYITVFRHPLDVLFSMRRHVANMTDPRLAPQHPQDLEAAMTIFLSPDPALFDVPTLAAILDHYRAALERSSRPNVLQLHYSNLQRDLAANVAQIADHLRVEIFPERLAEVAHAAQFTSMKAQSALFAPAQGRDFWRDDNGFFDSASSGKWVGQLGPTGQTQESRGLACGIVEPAHNERDGGVEWALIVPAGDVRLGRWRGADSASQRLLRLDRTEHSPVRSRPQTCRSSSSQRTTASRPSFALVRAVTTRQRTRPQSRSGREAVRDFDASLARLPKVFPNSLESLPWQTHSSSMPYNLNTKRAQSSALENIRRQRADLVIWPRGWCSAYPV